MSQDDSPGKWYEKILPFLWYDCVCALWTAVVAVYVEISNQPPVIRLEEISKRSGHVAIITGGPRGLAVGLIKRLLQLDYTVIMGVRSIEDSTRRLLEFEKSNPSLPVDNVRLLEMDLLSLNSIRKFADQVNTQTPRIDLLLCNAANMREPYRLSEDGYESQFQVNYLSQFLLTQLLMEKLKETAVSKGTPCKIIYTSSLLHKAGHFYFDELAKPIVYTRNKFYYASKLCQVASMLNLSRKLEEEGAQVHCYAVHPGLVPTEIWYTGMGPCTSLIGHLFRPLFRTVENAADTILWPAFSPEFQHKGGFYMENGMAQDTANEARNQKNQFELYEQSLQLIKTK